ncbi:MAG: hypothetical protein ABIT76_15500 [Chthoniobacterales bacterium]
MKLITKLTLLLTLTAAPLALIHAQDASPVPAESSPSTKVAQAPKAVPFRGTVSAVDAGAKTFTISSKDGSKVRNFSLSAAAKVTKDGKDITLADVKAGDYARGSGVKVDENKTEVNSVKFGPKSAEEIAADQKKKEAREAKKKE